MLQNIFLIAGLCVLFGGFARASRGSRGEARAEVQHRPLRLKDVWDGWTKVVDAIHPEMSGTYLEAIYLPFSIVGGGFLFVVRLGKRRKGC